MPPLYDVVLSPPNSISETLLQMLQHPLRLMSTANNSSKISGKLANSSTNSSITPTPLISKECATLILSSFIEEILVPEYTKPIRLFVIPCLTNNIEFPFLHLLQHLSDSIGQECGNDSNSSSAQKTIEYNLLIDSSMPHSTTRNNYLVTKEKMIQSSYLFHSFVALGQLNLELIDENVIWVRNYINVLGVLSENIRKLLQRSSHPLFRQYDMEIEADDDSDSDEEDEGKMETISSTERDCLFEAVTLLNDQKHVEFILQNTEKLLDDDQVLYSLCKICHNLMLHHRTAIFEFR